MSNQEIVSLGKQNYMSNYSQFPIAIRSGKGICLTDEDGKEYLDFVAGIAVNALGYGNEDEKKALRAGYFIHPTSITTVMQFMLPKCSTILPVLRKSSSATAGQKLMRAP